MPDNRAVVANTRRVCSKEETPIPLSNRGEHDADLAWASTENRLDRIAENREFAVRRRFLVSWIKLFAREHDDCGMELPSKVQRFEFEMVIVFEFPQSG